MLEDSLKGFLYSPKDVDTFLGESNQICLIGRKICSPAFYCVGSVGRIYLGIQRDFDFRIACGAWLRISRIPCFM